MVPSLLSSQRQYTAPIALPESWKHLMKIPLVPQSHPHKSIRCKNTLWSKLPPQRHEYPMAEEQLGYFLCSGPCHQIWKDTGLWDRVPAPRGAVWKCLLLWGLLLERVLGVEQCQFSKWDFGRPWPPSGSENPL